MEASETPFVTGVRLPCVRSHWTPKAEVEAADQRVGRDGTEGGMTAQRAPTSEPKRSGAGSG